MHPWFSGSLHKDWLIDLEDQLRRSPHASVGEIGLDAAATDSISGLKYDFETQMHVFKSQYDLACKLNRSVSIHAVQVAGKLFDFLENHDKSPPSIMMHSFNASQDMIKRLLKLKGVGSTIYFSLGSVVNLRSKKFKDMVLSIPDDKILIESDSHEFLSVDSQIELILQELAKVKEWDLDMATSIMEKNTTNYLLHQHQQS